MPLSASKFHKPYKIGLSSCLNTLFFLHSSSAITQILNSELLVDAEDANEFLFTNLKYPNELDEETDDLIRENYYMGRLHDLEDNQRLKTRDAKKSKSKSIFNIWGSGIFKNLEISISGDDEDDKITTASPFESKTDAATTEQTVTTFYSELQTRDFLADLNINLDELAIEITPSNSKNYDVQGPRVETGSKSNYLSEITSEISFNQLMNNFDIKSSAYMTRPYLDDSGPGPTKSSLQEENIYETGTTEDVFIGLPGDRNIYREFELPGDLNSIQESNKNSMQGTTTADQSTESQSNITTQPQITTVFESTTLDSTQENTTTEQTEISNTSSQSVDETTQDSTRMSLIQELSTPHETTTEGVMTSTIQPNTTPLPTEKPKAGLFANIFKKINPFKSDKVVVSTTSEVVTIPISATTQETTRPTTTIRTLGTTESRGAEPTEAAVTTTRVLLVDHDSIHQKLLILEDLLNQSNMNFNDEIAVTNGFVPETTTVNRGHALINLLKDRFGGVDEGIKELESRETIFESTTSKRAEATTTAGRTTESMTTEEMTTPELIEKTKAPTTTMRRTSARHEATTTNNKIYENLLQNQNNDLFQNIFESYQTTPDYDLIGTESVNEYYDYGTTQDTEIDEQTTRRNPQQTKPHELTTQNQVQRILNKIDKLEENLPKDLMSILNDVEKAVRKVETTTSGPELTTTRSTTTIWSTNDSPTTMMTTEQPRKVINRIIPGQSPAFGRLDIIPTEKETITDITTIAPRTSSHITTEREQTTSELITTTIRPTRPTSTSTTATTTMTTTTTTQPKLTCPDYRQLISKTHSSIVIKNYKSTNQQVTFNIGCREGYISPNNDLTLRTKELSCSSHDPNDFEESHQPKLLKFLSTFRCRYNECKFVRCRNGGTCVYDFLGSQESIYRKIGNVKFLSNRNMKVMTKCDCSGTGFTGKLCEVPDVTKTTTTTKATTTELKTTTRRARVQEDAFTSSVTKPTKVAIKQKTQIIKPLTVTSLFTPRPNVDSANSCLPGFYKRPWSKPIIGKINYDCIDINECSLPDSKINENSTYVSINFLDQSNTNDCNILTKSCQNKVGSYNCNCKKGLKKSKNFPQFCVNQEFSKICQKNVCKNKGRCQIFGDGLKCYCEAGYGGKFCENRLSREQKVKAKIRLDVDFKEILSSAQSATDFNSKFYETKVPIKFTENLEFSRFFVSDNGAVVFTTNKEAVDTFDRSNMQVQHEQDQFIIISPNWNDFDSSYQRSSIKFSTKPTYQDKLYLTKNCYKHTNPSSKSFLKFSEIQSFVKIKWSNMVPIRDPHHNDPHFQYQKDDQDMKKLERTFEIFIGASLYKTCVLMRNVSLPMNTNWDNFDSESGIFEPRGNKFEKFKTHLVSDRSDRGLHPGDKITKFYYQVASPSKNIRSLYIKQCLNHIYRQESKSSSSLVSTSSSKATCPCNHNELIRKKLIAKHLLIKIFDIETFDDSVCYRIVDLSAGNEANDQRSKRSSSLCCYERSSKILDRLLLPDLGFTFQDMSEKPQSSGNFFKNEILPYKFCLLAGKFYEKKFREIRPKVGEFCFPEIDTDQSDQIRLEKPITPTCNPKTHFLHKSLKKCLKINPCTSRPNICDQKSSTCTFNGLSHQCLCKPGFIGPNCNDINECKMEENSTLCINSICENLPGSYKCNCLSGFEKDTNTTCVNVDECSRNLNICGLNADCLDLPGGFSCKCHERYTKNDRGECVFDFERKKSSKNQNFSAKNKPQICHHNLYENLCYKSSDLKRLYGTVIFKDLTFIEFLKDKTTSQYAALESIILPYIQINLEETSKIFRNTTRIVTGGIFEFLEARTKVKAATNTNRGIKVVFISDFIQIDKDPSSSRRFLDALEKKLKRPDTVIKNDMTVSKLGKIGAIKVDIMGQKCDVEKMVLENENLVCRSKKPKVESLFTSTTQIIMTTEMQEVNLDSDSDVLGISNEKTEINTSKWAHIVIVITSILIGFLLASLATYHIYNKFFVPTRQENFDVRYDASETFENGPSTSVQQTSNEVSEEPNPNPRTAPNLNMDQNEQNYSNLLEEMKSRHTDLNRAAQLNFPLNGRQDSFQSTVVLQNPRKPVSRRAAVGACSKTSQSTYDGQITSRVRGIGLDDTTTEILKYEKERDRDRLSELEASINRDLEENFRRDTSHVYDTPFEGRLPPPIYELMDKSGGICLGWIFVVIFRSRNFVTFLTHKNPTPLLHSTTQSTTKTLQIQTPLPKISHFRRIKVKSTTPKSSV